MLDLTSDRSDKHGGDLADECADVFFYYGRALLAIAKTEDNFVGEKVEQADQQQQESDSDDDDDDDDDGAAADNDGRINHYSLLGIISLRRGGGSRTDPT